MERQLPFLVGFSRLRDALGRYRFREAGIALAEGRSVAGACNILCACILRPGYVLRRLREVYHFRRDAKKGNEI